MIISTSHKKDLALLLTIWLVISGCVLSLFLKAWDQARTLKLHNATDSLMLLAELANESGMDYIQAKAAYAEMLHKYVRLMESRHPFPLLMVPPLSKNNIVKELKRAANDLEGELSPGSEADQQRDARKKIEAASEAIAEFFSKSKPFTDEPIITFGPGTISEEIRTAIKGSLKESHEKVEIYANDKNMANSEAAHRANTKAIVYLYIARYGCHEIVSQETLREFGTDMNRTVYYNRALQQTDAIKGGEVVKDSDYWRLDRRSVSDILHLRLLRLIIDNDIRQAHFLLQIAAAKG